MRNTQEIKEFIGYWKNKSLPDIDLIEEYQGICTDLLYEDEELLREVTEILKKNIYYWALKKSKVYSKLKNKDFVQKEDLLNKEEWFVEGIPFKPMSTSGTTTGKSFHYRRWKDCLYFLECDNHYDLIMDEFNIQYNPNILFLINAGHRNYNDSIEIIENPNNFIESHGIKRNSIVHYVNFKEFEEDRKLFFDKIIQHITKYKIDVTLTTGSLLSSLCNYLENNGLNIKVSSLVSSTNEMLCPRTVDYIRENNVFDNICDHMRCWDGGASFFTCLEGNYHLMDNVSWCTSKENRLISTDYFSIASPFVNYWNGDSCNIDENFSRCDCGRLYRDFELLESRPFLIKGKSVLELKNKLHEWKQIKEIRCLGKFLELVLYSNLNQENEVKVSNKIKEILNWDPRTPPIKIKFTLEEHG